MQITDLVKVSDSVPDIGQAWYEKLQMTQKNVGMWFFVLGGVLHHIKEGEYWRGRAESWAGFCASEGLTYGDAQEKIRLYQEYVVRLRLPEETLETLASRDKTALSKAAPHITEENKWEWVDKLTHLARQDIVIEVRQAGGKPSASQTLIDKAVIAYRILNTEEKMEFHSRIGSQG